MMVCFGPIGVSDLKQPCYFSYITQYFLNGKPIAKTSLELSGPISIRARGDG